MIKFIFYSAYSIIMFPKIITVVVGSTNPVKINAIKNTMSTYYPESEIKCKGLNAPSLVSEQPMTSQETREGAINRLRYCQKVEDADFYAAIEGGVDLFEDGASTFAYIIIANNERMSVGRGANLPLPLGVYTRLKEGDELGPLMDELFNTKNIKQKGGAIGLLTNGYATREANYTQAAILTMAPFIHAEFYQ